MTDRRIVFGILAVATLMRAWGIWSIPLWYDENFTLLVARLPLDRMMLAIQGDVHPPLWYLTVWPIIQLGAPGWAMRIPAVIFSMLGLCIFWRILGKLQVARVPALIAFGIMATSPWQLYYAQEARMYAELQFLVLLAFEAAYDRNWLRFFLASALLFYCQNYGPIYAVAIGLFMIARDAEQFWRAWHGETSPHWMWLPWDDSYEMIRAGGRAATLFLPWLAYATIPQMAYLHSTGYWIGQASNASLGMILTRFMFGMTLGSAFLIPAIYIAMFTMTCSVIWIIANRPEGWLPLLVMAWAPIILAAAVSLFSMPILLHRPLIACSPFLFTILAYSIAPLKDASRRIQIFAAIFLVPVLLIAPLGYVVNSNWIRGGDELSKSETLIRSQWQQGDVIYIVGDGPLVNISAILPDLPIYRFPECQPTISYLSAQTRRAMGVIERPFEDVHAKRYWLIVGIMPFSPQCERDFIDHTIGENNLQFSQGNNPLITGGIYLVRSK